MQSNFTITGIFNIIILFNFYGDSSLCSKEHDILAFLFSYLWLNIFFASK